jgi:hypothetical protein
VLSLISLISAEFCKRYDRWWSMPLICFFISKNVEQVRIFYLACYIGYLEGIVS